MNKIHLIAALSVIIAGTMTSIPTADAQALCTQDNPDCCPPQMAPYCGLTTDAKFTECPFCGSELDKFVYQGTILNDYRVKELIQFAQVQNAQIVNLQKDIDSMKGAVITEGITGVDTIDLAILGLVGVAIVIGIANLARYKAPKAI